MLLLSIAETSALPKRGTEIVIVSGTKSSGIGICIEGTCRPSWGMERLGVVRAAGKLSSSVDFPPRGTGIAIVKYSLLKL